MHNSVAPNPLTTRYEADYWRLSAARVLARYLVRIAKERGLGAGFEHVLFAALSGEIDEPKLTENDRHLLEGLAHACGGWVRWIEAPKHPLHPLGDAHLVGAEWIEIDAWREIHRKRAA